MAEGDIKAGRAVWDLVSSHAMFSQGLKAAGAAMGQFANIVKSTQFIVAAASAAMGVAVFKAAQKAVGMAAVLDASLREVATLIPQTTEQLGGLRDALIDMSTRVPAPPELLTQGVYQAISAGITDTSEALQLVETSAKAAVAGLTDTFTAVDAITTVLNAYQLETTEAVRISDVLFKTVEQGKIRFPELAQNIGTVVTSASLAGIAFEEVSAAIATVTKFGIGAAEATTSLNRAILSIIKPTKQQTDAAAQYGVELSAAALAEKGLVGFVNELNAATEGQVDALAKVFPNIRAFKSIAILAGKGIDEYNRILLETENSAGAAANAFEEVNGSLSNQGALLRNNINVLFQKLGAKILPSVVAVLEGMNETLKTHEERWREAAEAAGDYETVVNTLRQEAIERLQDEMAKLQAQLSVGAQEWSRVQLPGFGSGFISATDDIKRQLEDIKNLTVDFDHDLESATQRARELVEDWEELRKFVKLTVDDNEAIVGFLNLRINAMNVLIGKAERLDVVERSLGDKSRARTEQELLVADLREKLETARDLAPASDYTKELDKQFRIEKARLDIQLVQNELLQLRVVTGKSTIADLEKEKKLREDHAAAARVEVARLVNRGILIGGGVAANIAIALTQERIAKLIGDEIAARKILQAILDGNVASTEDMEEANKELIKAVKSFIAAGGDIRKLGDNVEFVADAFLEIDLDKFYKELRQDEVIEFIKALTEGLKGLAEFVKEPLKLPGGIEELAVGDVFDATKLGGFRRELEDILQTGQKFGIKVLAIDGALQKWELSIDDLPPALRQAVEEAGYLGVEIEGSDENMLRLIDDISFAVNSALALADAFGASSQEINTIVRNVDLLARSIERIVTSGGLDFQSAFGIGSSLLSIGASVLGVGGGESADEKRRREAIEKNTLAINRLRVVTDAQIQALRGILSDDLAYVGDAITTFNDSLDEPPASGRNIGFQDFTGADLEAWIFRVLGIDPERLRRIADLIPGFNLRFHDGVQAFLDDVAAMDIALRNLDLDVLRQSFDGVREWEQLVADVFDKDLTPELNFDILVQAINKQLNTMENMERAFENGSDVFLKAARLVSATQTGTLEERLAAAEELQRFLVEHFDELFLLGFFGGMTADQAKELILAIDASTDAFDELADEAVDQSFQIFRGITEVTANRIVGTLETVAFWGRETAINTELMVGLLSGPVKPPRPEDLDRFAANGTTDQVVIEEFTVEVNVEGALDDDTAREVGRVAAEEFDRALGESYEVKRRSVGTRPVRTA